MQELFFNRGDKKPMNIKLSLFLVAAVFIFAFKPSVQADTYTTFKTTNYYSANRRFFVKVAPNERATLYGKKNGWRKLWSRKLPGLPSRIFVTNDGKRVMMIDYYYGNNHSSKKDVVYFFNENGSPIQSYSLDRVANLQKVLHTTSTSHWYYGAYFAPEQNNFIIETAVLKCPLPRSVQTEADSEAVRNCWNNVPYEELMFSTAAGQLTSRTNIQDKYSDTEKKLLHDLELAKKDSPLDYLQLSGALLKVANFYHKQGSYKKAQEYYEKAIPIYHQRLGNFDNVGIAISEMAMNYQRLGNYLKAEQNYKKALTILDKNRGRPQEVTPRTITVYEDYASLLKKRGRSREATVLIARAEILRSIYPDYKEN